MKEIIRPADDGGNLRYRYIGSLGPLPTDPEIADGATEVDVDVYTRDTGMVDVVIWSEDSVDGPQSVLQVLQLTPTHAQSLAALLLEAAGPRPSHTKAVITN